jgi:hypothetical protein
MSWTLSNSGIALTSIRRYFAQHRASTIFPIRFNFDPSVLRPTPGKHHLPYTLDAGTGETFGLRLSKYGRYANNLLCAANAIGLARALRWRWVQLCDVDFMRTFEALEIDGTTLLHPHASPPQGVRFLSGPYFRSADFGPWIQNLGRRDLFKIIAASVRPALEIPSIKVPDDQLVIHIRSGDVFKVRPPRRYAQPPLNFYTLIISALREAGEINSVCLVSEDGSNPCVGALSDYLGRTGLPFRKQSGTFAEDAAVVFGARRVVFGVGTFGLGVAATSDRLREVYAFRHRNFDAFPAHTRVWLVEAGDDYIPRDGWTGSPEQLALMISYPADRLELKKLV